MYGTPLQYSCLENPMDGGAWWAAVHGVARSRTRLSDLTFTFHLHVLEKEMAIHSGILPWRIPGTEEPSGLPSMGSHRVGHDWSDLAAAAKTSNTEHLYRMKCKKIFLIMCNIGRMLSTFSCAYWPFVHLLWRNIYSILCSFLNWAVYLSIVTLLEFFMYFGH